VTGFADLKTLFKLPAQEGRPRIAAVVLAAGSSRRMGDRHKLLLDVAGVPMIRRTVRNVLDASPVETAVVTGHRADEIEAALAGLPVKFARNPDHEQGQPTSVAAGVRVLSAPCDAVMIVLGDQPQLTSADLAELISVYRRVDGPSIVVPHHKGRRGNPVIFAARHIPEVLSGSVNVGCRHLIETRGDEVARPEMESDVFTLDCDTPEDFERLLRRLETAR
jgi:molybdenum cofactor cytidylyltransferase